MQHKFLGARLSAMMFLEFFVWGAWGVTVGNYMNRAGMGREIYWAFTVGPIAGIVSPFFLGMVADRFFAAERVLGALHILGGIAMFCAPLAGEGEWQSPLLFIVLLLLHMLCYMPTLGLVNTLCFHNMKSQEKQFPLIRVFGTIGWIAAGFVVSFSNADESAQQFTISGAAAVLLGLYSFTLPHTPPVSGGKQVQARDVLGLDALALLRSPSFLVFVVSSFLICIPLAAYYSYAGVYAGAAGFHSPAFTMTFGQMSEILFMLAMPLFFARLGVKWMLLVGMLAWALRYSLFASAATEGTLWMIFLGILLHGICYDFFFVTGQIYVDKKAPVKIRGQAQGFLVLVTLGLGMLIGAQVVGRIVNSNERPDAAVLQARANELRTQYREIQERAKASPESLTTQEKAESEAMWKESSRLLLEAHDWKTIWRIPAACAAIILVIFAIFFRDAAADAGSRDVDDLIH